MSSTALWYLSRATGVLATVLLSTVFVLGLVVSRGTDRGRTSTVVMGLHRTLSLGMSAFLIVHVLTAVLDTYVPIGVLSAVLPFASAYQTVWVTIGTLAFDALIAVVLTSLLRHRLPENLWRTVHWTAYLLWPGALAHGYFLGTSGQPWLRWITLGCGAVGVAAVGWRLVTSTQDAGRRRLIATQEWR